LDLKYHDIPNTVVSAVRSAVRLGVQMLNIHCIGGRKMMETVVTEVRRESDRVGGNKPLLLGVTVLTSMSEEDLKSDLLVQVPLKDYVVHLATLAQKCGMDGVVCSPKEIELLRKNCGPDFKLVTPGIRPAWAAEQHDQQRIMTPNAALAAGADYIVIGRPIIGAQEPERAAERVLQELH